MTNDQSPRAPAAGPLDERELSRARMEAAFHKRLRELTAAFSQDVSSTLSIDGPLRTFAAGANALLGGHRTSIWLHQRRIHTLSLSASSDVAATAPAASAATDDLDAPAAQGLRMERAQLRRNGGQMHLLVPLRGWRRALGTLVVEGPFSSALSPDQLEPLAHEIGQQLSAAVENIQLLEEILRQRRLLEDTFNSLLDLVIVTDTDLRVVQANEAFVVRAGLSQADVVDRPLDSLVSHELAAWAASTEPAPLDRKNPSNAENGTNRLEDARLNGTFLVTMSALISHAGEPVGRVIVMRDITAQTRLEREREALRQRLEQSQKLAALGQFVAGIAHEMNNPLQGVMGHLELLLKTSEAARPLRRDLRGILHEADRAARIVKDLLIFTGSRRIARRRLRVTRVISRVIASRAVFLRNAAIEVVRDEDADLPPIAGDALLLHQALLNIFINAEHAIASSHMPGRIHVRARRERSSGTIVLSIADTGPGIPPDVLPRIFEPFFTTRDVGKGTGLGLAITYGIVQEHGGAIHAHNDPAGGAVFTIEFPAAGGRV